jgi:hypothetical protein
MGQSPAGKNMSMEAEDIAATHHQVMTEDTADWKGSACCSELQECELEIALYL